MASKLDSLVGFLRKPKKGHFYHQNSYKGIDNYLLDCARVSLDNDAMTQEWSIKVADAVNSNADAIAENAKNIATNAENIATNTEDIATNTENIATNAKNIATNASDITKLKANYVGCTYIVFNYTRNSIEDDYLYWTHDEDEGKYSYLVVDSDTFSGSDGLSMMKTLAKSSEIISSLLVTNGYTYDIDIMLNDDGSPVIALRDNAYIRATDDGSKCVNITSDSKIVCYRYSYYTSTSYTIYRKASE